MVFSEIDSITDVVNGHRIIIYYIKGKLDHHDKKVVKLFKNTETALELLAKKNDDVLLVEIPHSKDHFKQFVDLYKPEITGPITLFAVNNEGIPLISENISDVINIFNAIERISTACNLKEIPKLGQHFVQTKEKETILEHYKLFSDEFEEFTTSSKEIQVAERAGMDSSENIAVLSQNSLSTRLHIRLPNGAREELQFDNDATLQEVWISISLKFNIKDFDLKTYNHPIFSDDDYVQTLQNLDLCPRGVLIVIHKNAMPLNNTGRISGIIQYGFYQLISLPTNFFQYMRGLLFVFWNYVFPSNNSSTFRKQEHKEIKSSSDSSNKSNSQGASNRYVSKNIGSNIHTLRRNDDSDDENNRYNGNSTQQK